MTVIGLGGKLRAGKDEIADHLVRHHGYVKIGMSDALHEAMLALDPFVEVIREHEPERYSEIVRQLGYIEAKKIPEVRRLLQALGTEVGRKMIGEDTWTNIVRRRIDELEEKGIPVVLTGLRFPNELQLITGKYSPTAWLLWVERPGAEAPSTATAAHSSENSVGADDFTFVLHNDGTLEELYAKVDELARLAASL
jgi:dephospho-CoA kinase